MMSLFQEIQSESLQKLLLSLQQDERSMETDIPAFDSCSGLHPGDVVHIRGPSGSGKTQLVYLLILACCLPPRYLSFQLGGWNKLAFVLDMDGTFDINRFHQILVTKIKKFRLATPVVDSTLERVHIFRPTSTEQLATTLAYLPKYHSKNCPDAVIGMVAIHSLDAFHWVDRFKAEQLSTTGPRRSTHQIIFSKLEAIGRSYAPIALLSYWGLPGNDDLVARSSYGPRVFDIQLCSTPTGSSRDCRHAQPTKAVARVASQDCTVSFSFEIGPPSE